MQRKKAAFSVAFNVQVVGTAGIETSFFRLSPTAGIILSQNSEKPPHDHDTERKAASLYLQDGNVLSILFRKFAGEVCLHEGENQFVLFLIGFNLVIGFIQE